MFKYQLPTAHRGSIEDTLHVLGTVAVQKEAETNVIDQLFGIGASAGITQWLSEHTPFHRPQEPNEDVG